MVNDVRVIEELRANLTPYLKEGITVQEVKERFDFIARLTTVPAPEFTLGEMRKARKSTIKRLETFKELMEFENKRIPLDALVESSLIESANHAEQELEVDLTPKN